MEQPNHNTEEYTVYQMVLNRLPFLADNSGNKKLISNFTLEVMNELEPCFRVRFTTAGTEQFSRIGDEANYNVVMKTIIADIVSMQILVIRAIQTSAGSSEEGAAAPTPTFMSKVKAGTVEIEYDQFKSKDSTLLAMDTDTLMETFRKNAIKRAGSMGCVIDITDDFAVTFTELLMNSSKIQPFIISAWGGDGGCGCC